MEPIEAVPLSHYVDTLSVRMLAFGDRTARTYVLWLRDVARLVDKGEDVQADLGFELRWVAERFRLRGDKTGALQAAEAASEASARQGALARRGRGFDYPATTLPAPSPEGIQRLSDASGAPSAPTLAADPRDKRAEVSGFIDDDEAEDAPATPLPADTCAVNPQATDLLLRDDGRLV